MWIYPNPKQPRPPHYCLHPPHPPSHTIHQQALSVAVPSISSFSQLLPIRIPAGKIAIQYKFIHNSIRLFVHYYIECHLSRIIDIPKRSCPVSGSYLPFMLSIESPQPATRLLSGSICIVGIQFKNKFLQHMTHHKPHLDSIPSTQEIDIANIPGATLIHRYTLKLPLNGACATFIS